MRVCRARTALQYAVTHLGHGLVRSCSRTQAISRSMALGRLLCRAPCITRWDCLATQRRRLPLHIDTPSRQFSDNIQWWHYAREPLLSDALWSILEVKKKLCHWISHNMGMVKAAVRRDTIVLVKPHTGSIVDYCYGYFIGITLG